MVTALVSMSTVGVGVAHAATVYEIEADWEANTPGTVAKGDVVTGIWRVNVNDDAEAPANEPVEDVTVTVTVQHGLLTELPGVCLTGDDLDPVSSISEDGRTLTCNLGTVDQGTAVVLQTPVVADGVTGDQITATGQIGEETDELDPINIRNVFGMDIAFGTPSTARVFRGDDTWDFNMEWTLFQDRGSDPGPDTITYDLDIRTDTGQALVLGYQNNIEGSPFNAPCTPFRITPGAPGHPYSSGTGNNVAPFVESCELVKTGATTFTLTLSGIDYSQLQVPTHDSLGNPLPVDTVAVASGDLWLRIPALTEPTTVDLRVLDIDPSPYESTTGLTDPDETPNNTSQKLLPLGGAWDHYWDRTGHGGTRHDNTLKGGPGAAFRSHTDDTRMFDRDYPANYLLGGCDVLDNRYTDYVDAALTQLNYDTNTWEPVTFGSMQWYVGPDPTLDPASAQYNPDAFEGCGGGAGWVNTEPTDKTSIKAVRWTATVAQTDRTPVSFRVDQVIETDAPIGMDVWSWGARSYNGVWDYPTRGVVPSGGAVIPDGRYNRTGGGRDVLHVVFANPAVSKTVNRSVVQPGVPATFTLTYSANGTGNIPTTVDDYTIVDTLPVGLTYVEGSADPAPTVTTDGQGRQVLTWSLDGVPTNANSTLTYQASAGDSVTPGQTLTNTVTTSLRGVESRPDTAQVTVSTAGYTLIGKTTEQWFMNNPDGEGNSTGSWTVTLRSADPLPQAWTDTIDVLPYNGDGRGTDFEGTYSVTSVEAPAGATVYYTTADRETLSDDPADDVNGAPNAPSDIWSTEAVPNPTAIRVIGGELAPSGTFSFDIHIATEGADAGDVWVNRAQARAEHTGLVMRTSEPLTMGTRYSASLKKYVQDRDGEWHDAQDASDYPVFRIGDEVTYRIGVTNTGQGTIRNTAITDDKFDQGSFTIEELAPGEVEYHEFTTTIEGSFETSYVNTACATADQPEDSEDPVLINCDPAGIEVVNYKTVKTSDPSGADVQPGDTVTYTVTVTQEGSYPAAAEWGDDLSDVLDDATIDEASITASTGTATLDGESISWSGEVGVGEVATVTYEAVVKSYEEITEGGNWVLDNVVFSDGCAAEGDCNPPPNPVGTYTQAKTSVPVPGSSVGPGDVVTYSVTVAQVGEAGVAGAFITDDLSGVLDDASYNGD
ncbi:DUF11 domain-containing protein, partial [Auraticoccus sp. F435]